jgi:hypothetical protein
MISQLPGACWQLGPVAIGSRRAAALAVLMNHSKQLQAAGEKAPASWGALTYGSRVEKAAECPGSLLATAVETTLALRARPIAWLQLLRGARNSSILMPPAVTSLRHSGGLLMLSRTKGKRKSARPRTTSSERSTRLRNFGAAAMAKKLPCLRVGGRDRSDPRDRSDQTRTLARSSASRVLRREQRSLHRCTPRMRTPRDCRGVAANGHTLAIAQSNVDVVFSLGRHVAAAASRDETLGKRFNVAAEFPSCRPRTLDRSCKCNHEGGRRTTFALSGSP